MIRARRTQPLRAVMRQKKPVADYRFEVPNVKVVVNSDLHNRLVQEALGVLVQDMRAVVQWLPGDGPAPVVDISFKSLDSVQFDLRTVLVRYEPDSRLARDVVAEIYEAEARRLRRIPDGEFGG